jgi:hypothetical protein
MAEFATIKSVRQTVQLLGGTHLEDVWEVEMETKPSEIFAVFRTPLLLGTPEYVALTADQIAQALELILRHNGVVDVAYRQDVTPAGGLLDLYDVYVASSSGLSSGIVTTKQQNLDFPREPLVLPLIDAEVTKLNALEGS